MAAAASALYGEPSASVSVQDERTSRKFLFKKRSTSSTCAVGVVSLEQSLIYVT
jgi:hypothetical protein